MGPRVLAREHSFSSYDVSGQSISEQRRASQSGLFSMNHVSEECRSTSSLKTYCPAFLTIKHHSSTEEWISRTGNCTYKLSLPFACDCQRGRFIHGVEICFFVSISYNPGPEALGALTGFVGVSPSRDLRRIMSVHHTVKSLHSSLHRHHMVLKTNMSRRLVPCDLEEQSEIRSSAFRDLGL